MSPVFHAAYFPSQPVQALAISPGLAIGPASLLTKQTITVTASSITVEQVDAEQQRLQSALNAAIAELYALQTHVEETVGGNEAAIFEAQQMMLEDPDLLAEVQALISGQLFSAEYALQQVSEQMAQELAALESEILAARAADLRDAVARALCYLTVGAQFIAPSVSHTNAPPTDSPAILVAYDLTPSDTASLNPRAILGICTVVGGPTTHAAILARALEIPAIAGIDVSLLDTLRDGQTIAIDGAQGLLYLSLNDEQERTLYATMHNSQKERLARRTQDDAQWRKRQGTTADGIAVQVFANVGDSESASAAGEAGAEGIGLLRTEFLFGGRTIFPDEEEQFEAYVALFRAFTGSARSGKTIIARTLDAGADKPFPALAPLIGELSEANPALGLRGARIHLVHEGLLRSQLRALLRAAVQADIALSIMFPMIATLEEVRRLRSIYEHVREELLAEHVQLPTGIPIGIMIETPAAAIMADVLAREVDFFSIGANDLYQYTMAADRTNGRVAAMFGLLEPAVWHLIDHVVRAGAKHGKLVALCGELAADPRIGPLLAGLGVQELSMSPPSIVRVKAALHQHPMAYWQRLAHEMLAAETAADMRSILDSIE